MRRSVLRRCGTVTSGVTLFLTLLGCGLGEAHFQAAWRREILAIQPKIQEYWEWHGRLPNELADVNKATTGDYAAVVQYRKENERQYLLWIKRMDIHRFASKTPDREFQCTLAGPERGDVFGRFDVQGRVLSASWRI